MTELKLKFGFASKRPPKKEPEAPLFDYPYIEMCAANDMPGSVSKFKLVNGVAGLLGFVSTVGEEYNRVAYAQNETEPEVFYLANVNSLDKLPVEHKVNKDDSFNSTALHKRICSELNLDPHKSHYFSVVKVPSKVGEVNSIPVIELTLIEMNSVESDTSVEIEDVHDDVEIPNIK